MWDARCEMEKCCWDCYSVACLKTLLKEAEKALRKPDDMTIQAYLLQKALKAGIFWTGLDLLPTLLLLFFRELYVFLFHTALKRSFTQLIV